MLRLATIVLLLIFAIGLLGPPSASAEGCQFVLGFKTIRDALPSQVGDCKTEEYHNPLTGDTLQETTGGLLVWRKSDNWTAFTDGYRTWVNGPHGLLKRPNTERFSWESDPPPTATPAPQEPIAVPIAEPPALRCFDSDLGPLYLPGTYLDEHAMYFVKGNLVTFLVQVYGYDGTLELRLYDAQYVRLWQQRVVGHGEYTVGIPYDSRFILAVYNPSVFAGKRVTINTQVCLIP